MSDGKQRFIWARPVRGNRQRPRGTLHVFYFRPDGWWAICGLLSEIDRIEEDTPKNTGQSCAHCRARMVRP